MHAFFGEPLLSHRGWETAAAAQERIADALETVLARSPADGDVAIVSHGGVGTLLLCQLKGTAIHRAEDQPGQGHWFAFDRDSRPRAARLATALSAGNPAARPRRPPGAAAASRRSPPSRRTSSRATARPTPPSPVLKRRSNKWSACSGSIPGPESRTTTGAVPAAGGDDDRRRAGAVLGGRCRAARRGPGARSPRRPATGTSPSALVRQLAAGSGEARRPVAGDVLGGEARRGRAARASPSRPRASSSRCSITDLQAVGLRERGVRLGALVRRRPAIDCSSSRRMRSPVSGPRSWCEALALNSRSRRSSSAIRRVGRVERRADPVDLGEPAALGRGPSLAAADAARPGARAAPSARPAGAPAASASPTAAATAASESRITASHTPPVSSTRSVARRERRRRVSAPEPRTRTGSAPDGRARRDPAPARQHDLEPVAGAGDARRRPRARRRGRRAGGARAPPTRRRPRARGAARRAGRAAGCRPRRAARRARAPRRARSARWS